jgi:SOS response regulatory protein OraA/RecX
MDTRIEQEAQKVAQDRMKAEGSHQSYDFMAVTRKLMKKGYSANQVNIIYGRSRAIISQARHEQT